MSTPIHVMLAGTLAAVPLSQSMQCGRPGQLDASAFFNITDDIRVGVQGVNLLNEVTRTSQAFTGDPNDLAPRSFFVNDRRFSFILRANF